MDSQKLITMAEAMAKFKMGRTTIDRKCKAGIFQKYTLPGSNRVYLDETEIVNAFVLKTQTHQPADEVNSN